MGQEKIQRPIWTQSIECSSAATFAKRITVSQGTKDTVQTVTSTGTTIASYGAAYLSSTAAGTKKYVIGAPSSGATKIIFATVLSGSSALRKIISGSTTIFFQTTAGAAMRGISFKAAGRSVTLKGVSATKWAVVSNIGTTSSTSA